MEPKYKRILLKLSGEALAGDKKIGLDYDVITSFGKSIKKCVDAGVEVGIVVGGGNFWRGRSSGAMDRTRAEDNYSALFKMTHSLVSDVRLSDLWHGYSCLYPYLKSTVLKSVCNSKCVHSSCQHTDMVGSCSVHCTA